MIGKILDFLGGGVLDSAKGFYTAIAGDTAARETDAHTEQMAVYNQFAAEFGHARTWWDSFIDGLNRLPRPFMTFGTLALFAWCVVDPPAFIEAMGALSAVPEMLWVIFLTIVGFWFGGKMISKDIKYTPPSVEKIKALNDLASEARYQREMADTEKPLSNAAILEWNRRRRGK